MQLKITSLVLLLGLAFQVDASIQPRFKEITLASQLPLVVTVPPDHGVRLIFPFALEEDSGDVPFAMIPTNPVFRTERPKGRNTIVISYPPQQSGSADAVYQGNLFINVAGYNLSILLKTSLNMTDYYSDIVFTLDPEAEAALFKERLNIARQQLQQDYEARQRQLDEQASQMAMANIGWLAMNKPVSESVKQEKRVDLDNGDKVSVYVDQLISYGSYHTFVLELENDSLDTPLVVEDARIFGLNSEKREIPVPVVYRIASRIGPRDTARGAITTDQGLDAYAHYKVVLLTSRGQVDVIW